MSGNYVMEEREHGHIYIVQHSCGTGVVWVPVGLRNRELAAVAKAREECDARGITEYTLLYYRSTIYRWGWDEQVIHKSELAELAVVAE